MKKALFIMAAALLMMTQCRKESATPNMPADGTVKMTVTAGPGRTDINTETGAITWSAGDKLYVSKNGSWLGCLELVSGENTANGTFAGDVTGIGDGDTPCHFFYLGHDNGMTEPAGSTAASISFAAQDGTLAGAMKYHIGYGCTDVTVTEGEATGYVEMNTKIAIAHINFTTDGTTAYTGAVTMGGTGISNTLSVSPDGSFSGSGSDGIAIGNGGGTTGERYVTLIPTGTTDVLSVAFTGDATGGMTFANGIEANKFYGMSNAIEVTVEAAAPAAVFSVADGTTVEFAPGNLYWDGSSWHFEANQWDFRTYAGKNSCIGGSVTEDGTPAGTVGSFFWSKTASVAYAGSYSDGGASTGDMFFTNASGFQVSGETAGTWRTLSKAEWNYLLNRSYGSLEAWVTLTDVSVSGLVLLPDGTENPSTVLGSITETSDLATYGAVFLPAAGARDGTDVNAAGSSGACWSGTPYEGNEGRAYSMGFYSGGVSVGYGLRSYGYSVRLVR